MAKIKVIDISYCQKSVDFKALKLAGVKAVIIRTGYLNKTDDMFHSHMKGAIAAGLDIGVYTYIMAKDTSQAVLEARQTVERLKEYKGYITYPVYCDMEDNRYLNGSFGKSFSRRLCTDIIKTFCNSINSAGYYAALYINPDWLENYTYKAELLGRYDIWLAAWTNNPKKPTRYDYGQKMWQWGTEKLNGIIKPVDSNFSYVDYPGIIKKAKKNFLVEELTETVKRVKLAYHAQARRGPAASTTSCGCLVPGMSVTVIIGSETIDEATGYVYVKVKRNGGYQYIVKSALEKY